MTGVPHLVFGAAGFPVYLHWSSRRFSSPSDVWSAMWSCWEEITPGEVLGLHVGEPPGGGGGRGLMAGLVGESAAPGGREVTT